MRLGLVGVLPSVKAQISPLFLLGFSPLCGTELVWALGLRPLILAPIVRRRLVRSSLFALRFRGCG